MTPARRGRLARAVAAAALALGLVVLPLSASASASASVDVTVTVPGPAPSEGTRYSNAQLRWGLNAESGGGAYAGGCNFLSAGIAGSTGGSVVWSAQNGFDRFYASRSGAARIEKPTATGGWAEASWLTKCDDTAGDAVRTAVGSSTGNQVVIDGGIGAYENGRLEIRWTGSFTVAFYGGMTYWSVSDPVLTLDAQGNGQLTGTAQGFGADMNDTSKWDTIAPQNVVLADIRGAATSSSRGFSVTPRYLSVPIEVRGGLTQVRTGGSWGAFPQSFVDFQRLTGQHAYWYSSGGAADPKKPASPVYVSYDAAAPIAVAPPADGGDAAGGASSAPANPLRLPPSLAAVTADAPPVLASFAAMTPITTQPEREGLVPGITGALSPLVAPLLGSAAALSLGIIAVLSMMQVLPWQRRLVP